MMDHVAIYIKESDTQPVFVNVSLLKLVGIFVCPISKASFTYHIEFVQQADFTIQNMIK
jgi:hypothetical protein